MDRQKLLDALAALPDDKFAHVAEVCHDIDNRLPGEGFEEIGKGARAALGLPEPSPKSEGEQA